MTDSQKAAVGAKSTERAETFTWLERTADAYVLKGTLDGYEVDELDGHDLAKYLPTIVLGDQHQQELESSDPERV